MYGYRPRVNKHDVGGPWDPPAPGRYCLAQCYCGHCPGYTPIAAPLRRDTVDGARVLHRANGWTAYFAKRFGRFGLPGDDPATVQALRVLGKAGMLPERTGEPGSWRYPLMPCPRCARPTSTLADHLPTVCAACRAEYMAPRVPRWVAVLLGWDRESS